MSAFERRLNSISYRIISYRIGALPQRQFRVGLRVQFINLGYHLLVK